MDRLRDAPHEYAVEEFGVSEKFGYMADRRYICIFHDLRVPLDVFLAS